MARPKPDDDEELIPPVLLPGCVAVVLSLLGIVLGLILLRELLQSGQTPQSTDAEFIIGAVLLSIGLILGICGIISCVYVHKYKGGEVQSHIERQYVEHRLSMDIQNYPELRTRLRARNSIAPVQESSGSSREASESGDHTDSTHITNSSENLVHGHRNHNTNELLTPPVNFNSSRRLSPFVIDVTSLRRSSAASLRRGSSTEEGIPDITVEPPGAVNVDCDTESPQSSVPVTRNIPIVRVNSGPIPPPDQYSIQCDVDDGHLSDTAPSA